MAEVSLPVLVAVRLPADMRGAVNELALAEGMTFSQWVRKCLSAELERRERAALTRKRAAERRARARAERNK